MGLYSKSRWFTSQMVNLNGGYLWTKNVALPAVIKSIVLHKQHAILLFLGLNPLIPQGHVQILRVSAISYVQN